MKHAFVAALWIAAFTMLPLPSWAGHGQYTPIESLVNESDAVLVGQIQDGTVLSSGWLLNVSIDRVLKGSGKPGDVLTVRYELPAGTRIPQELPNFRALWFLQRGTTIGEWALLPAGTGVPFLEAAVYKIKSGTLPIAFPYGANTSPLDKVISEIAQATEDLTGSYGYGDRIAAALGGTTTSLAPAIYRRWLASPSTDLQSFAIAHLIALDDADALLIFAAKAKNFLQSAAVVPIMVAINEYRNTQRVDAIQALGQLAVAGPESFRPRATYALSGIHNAAALPYLAKLLDSSDPAIRADAVAGISAFALSIPVAKSGEGLAEARDSVMNPARRLAAETTQTRDIYQNAHFGFFSNAAEESRVIQFWKTWIASH